MDYSPEEITFLKFCTENIPCELSECPARDICEQREKGKEFCLSILDKMGSGEELAEQDIDVVDFFLTPKLWKKGTCVPKDGQEPCPNSNECDKRPAEHEVCTVLLRKLDRGEVNKYGILEDKIQKVIVRDVTKSMIDWHASEGLKYYAEKPKIDVGEPDILLIGSKSKTLYVIELKAAVAKREHVGQLASYVGWYREHPEQCPEQCTNVKGILVAEDFDSRAIYALKACCDLEPRRFDLHVEIKPIELQ